MIEVFIFLHVVAYVTCQDNFTAEDTALFFRNPKDGQQDPETEKSVQSILTWLQKRYHGFGEKKGKSDPLTTPSHQPEFDSATMVPRPFGFSDTNAINNELLGTAESTGFPETTSTEAVVNNDIYPPQVQNLHVECQKDKMTVDIEFTSEFNGIIYSKDHFTTPECRYVVADSHSPRYRFTVQLNSCGTEFVNEYDKGGRAYLENVLVIQNEPGIVEIWDSVRSVRCLWEGTIKQQVTSGLSIVTPSTELVTFSGDTATAKLEIQTGKGPFSYPEHKTANIGDMMTLVITVEGDPEHAIRVGRCIAAGGGQEMQLSDDAGCPLRPKLMSAFEYTRNPQTNGAMAYSYFRAFKFPDSNELNFDCNVELCKTPCVPCQDTNNGIHRKKRSTLNDTADFSENELLKLQRSVWIATPQQLNNNADICMTTGTFYSTSFIVMALLLASMSVTFHAYITSKRLKGEC